jgi:hypothetical protein
MVKGVEGLRLNGVEVAKGVQTLVGRVLQGSTGHGMDVE